MTCVLRPVGTLNGAVICAASVATMKVCRQPIKVPDADDFVDLKPFCNEQTTGYD
jgi:hypothetical protein